MCKKYTNEKKELIEELIRGRRLSKLPKISQVRVFSSAFLEVGCT